MKGERVVYEGVKQLPANAMTVRQYAESVGFTVAHIYYLHKKGVVNIVTFAGVNFVIPNKT